MNLQRIVAADDWMVARAALVDEIKHLRDRLTADPHGLPFVSGEPAFAFAAGSPLDLFVPGEAGARGWTGLFDRLERYLAGAA